MEGKTKFVPPCFDVPLQPLAIAVANSEGVCQGTFDFIRNPGTTTAGPVCLRVSFLVHHEFAICDTRKVCERSAYVRSSDRRATFRL